MNNVHVALQKFRKLRIAFLRESSSRFSDHGALNFVYFDNALTFYNLHVPPLILSTRKPCCCRQNRAKPL